ncbi:XRE family transcriptional regulator [Ignicoccus pacificus DSM 13166]|uniref:XRE family transcriptional regulator n=1 Tax=Ignicoccus pacificus DSM 13166 TaxID=940294 RepID=A0A977KBT1_9CREN|nr:XRE family transcriptional regulator [Ignicoccus pacificus DSM 13166]
MKAKLYCEMCGLPIEGRPHRVMIEGTEMVLCERCYRSVRARAVPTEAPKKKKKEVKKEKPKKKVVEYEIVEDYAKRVREAREKLGMSREELGMKVGAGENIIKRIELGRLEPDMELAKKLEKVLGIKLIRKVEYEEGGEVPKPPSGGLTLGDIVVIRKD